MAKFALIDTSIVKRGMLNQQRCRYVIIHWLLVDHQARMSILVKFMIISIPFDLIHTNILVRIAFKLDLTILMHGQLLGRGNYFGLEFNAIVNCFNTQRIQLTLIAAFVGLAEFSYFQCPAVYIDFIITDFLDRSALIRIGVLTVFCKVLQILRQDSKSEIVYKVILINGERISQLKAIGILALIPDHDCVGHFAYDAWQLDCFIRMNGEITRIGEN